MRLKKFVPLYFNCLYVTRYQMPSTRHFGKIIYETCTYIHKYDQLNWTWNKQLPFLSIILLNVQWFQQQCIIVVLGFSLSLLFLTLCIYLNCFVCLNFICRLWVINTYLCYEHMFNVKKYKPEAYILKDKKSELYNRFWKCNCLITYYYLWLRYYRYQTEKFSLKTTLTLWKRN